MAAVLKTARGFAAPRGFESHALRSDRGPKEAGVEHVIVRATAEARPTAVLAATTTWQEYPQLWRRLLDQVHANVHWGGDGRKGRNVMLYHDDVPHVEVGVELDQPARIEAPVIHSVLPAGEVAM